MKQKSGQKMGSEKNYGRKIVWPQILAILVVCLVPITNGLLFSWTSPFILKITRDKENYNIDEDEASYLTVIPALAMIVASLGCAKLNDMIGRKRTILIIAVPHILSWVLCAVAKNIWTFYVARIFSGIGDGFLYSALPMYIGEITTPEVRGTWGNAMTFSMYIGETLIQIIGSYTNVQVTSFICLTIPLAFLLLFPFMPESPYYCVMKGKYERAKEMLRWLRRKEDVEKDFDILRAAVERQMSESGTWKDLFTIESNRRALYAGAFLRASQQLGGFTVFAVYTQLIFDKSGGSLSPQVSSIIFFCAFCVCNFLAGTILDKLGRRRAYIISTLFCGLILLVESVYFYIDEFEDSINIAFLKWIPITGMMLYVIFFSIGLGVVPTLMLGELFSTSIKAKGLGFLVIVFAVLMCVTAKLFHLLSTYIGLYSPFLLFSVNCFISTVLSLYLIPETKGKTLEEIQQDLKSKRSKNKCSETNNESIDTRC